jgi:hypothetical protein
VKLIIAGSRSITSPKIVREAILQSGWQNEITEVVSDCAHGVDKLGEMWAENNNIPVKRFPANWEKYGRKAGSLRNKQMSEYGDRLIAIWNGNSTGTIDMVKQMRIAEKPVYLHKV